MFSSKVSNFDAITTSMQLIAYSVLYDKYSDLSKIILTEIGSKLGNKDSRVNKIYFSRFIIITINHLVREVVLDRENDKLNCWTQIKRVVQDLVRINRNSWYWIDLSTLCSSIYLIPFLLLITLNSLPSYCYGGCNPTSSCPSSQTL